MVRIWPEWDGGVDPAYTKKVLKCWDLFLLVDNMELEILTLSDTTIQIPMLTGPQFQSVEDKEYLRMKVSKGGKCYVTLFPNLLIAEDTLTESLISLYFSFVKGSKPDGYVRKPRVAFYHKKRAVTPNLIVCEDYEDNYKDSDFFKK